MSKKYKTYTEIQASIKERMESDFDYYDTDDVCVIHVKFGDVRKLFTGLEVENNLPEEFITEYEKYWDEKGDMFKSARDVVDYIVNNDLPVILYDNSTDKELDKEGVYQMTKNKQLKELKNIIKIDTKGNVTQLDFDLKNVLAQAYREIECDTIDIATIYIGDVAVDVIVDDEGLMKDNPVPTVYVSKERQLFGNVLLVPSDIDDEGNYHRGFTERERVVIQNNIREFIDFGNGIIRKVLVSI